MLEQESSREELEAFREEMREAMEMAIIVVASGQETDPQSIDPFSLGISEETLAELTPEKLNLIKEELNILLGKSEETEANSTYETAEGIKVSVFEGIHSDEEGNDQAYFVHQIEHPDGALDWQITPTTDPLF